MLPTLPARRFALAAPRTILAAASLALLLAGALAGCRGARESAEADAPPATVARVEAIRAHAAALDSLDLSVGPRSLALGPISGRLGAGDAVAEGSPYDAYVTLLRAGATLAATLRTEAFAPVLAVLAPSGETHFGTSTDTSASLTVQASVAGRYLLLVMPDEGSTGGVYGLDVVSPGPVVAYPPELLR